MQQSAPAAPGAALLDPSVYKYNDTLSCAQQAHMYQALLQHQVLSWAPPAHAFNAMHYAPPPHMLASPNMMAGWPQPPCFPGAAGLCWNTPTWPHPSASAFASQAATPPSAPCFGNVHAAPDHGTSVLSPLPLHSLQHATRAPLSTQAHADVATHNRATHNTTKPQAAGATSSSNNNNHNGTATCAQQQGAESHGPQAASPAAGQDDVMHGDLCDDELFRMFAEDLGEPGAPGQLLKAKLTACGQEPHHEMSSIQSNGHSSTDTVVANNHLSSKFLPPVQLNNTPMLSPVPAPSMSPHPPSSGLYPHPPAVPMHHPTCSTNTTCTAAAACHPMQAGAATLLGAPYTHLIPPVPGSYTSTVFSASQALASCSTPPPPPYAMAGMSHSNGGAALMPSLGMGMGGHMTGFCQHMMPCPSPTPAPAAPSITPAPAASAAALMSRTCSMPSPTCSKTSGKVALGLGVHGACVRKPSSPASSASAAAAMAAGGAGGMLRRAHTSTLPSTRAPSPTAAKLAFALATSGNDEGMAHAASRARSPLHAVSNAFAVGEGGEQLGAGVGLLCGGVVGAGGEEMTAAELDECHQLAPTLDWMDALRDLA